MIPKLAKRKKGGTSERQKLVKLTDMYFSRYIRLSNAFLSSGELFVRCYTCGRIHSILDIENGHFIPRGKWKFRYDEKNCRPQCKYCNGYNGETSKITFRAKLINEYGQKNVEWMESQARTRYKMDTFSLQMNKEHYQKKCRELINKLGVDPWKPSQAR